MNNKDVLKKQFWNNSIWTLICAILTVFLSLGLKKYYFLYFVVFFYIIPVVHAKESKEEQEKNLLIRVRRDGMFGCVIGFIYLLIFILLKMAFDIEYIDKNVDSDLGIVYFILPFVAGIIYVVLTQFKPTEPIENIKNHIIKRDYTALLSISTVLSMFTIVGIVLFISSGIFYLVCKDERKKHLAKEIFIGSIIGLICGIIVKYVILTKCLGANKIIWYL